MCPRIIHFDVLTPEGKQQRVVSANDCFDVPNLKRLKYYRVMFHDGMKHLPPVLVVAQTPTQARVLAQSSIPSSLYGPNVVFMKADPSMDLPISLNEEDFKLIAEKAGVAA